MPALCDLGRTGLRGVPGQLRAEQQNTDSVGFVNCEYTLGKRKEIRADRHNSQNERRGYWRRRAENVWLFGLLPNPNATGA